MATGTQNSQMVTAAKPRTAAGAVFSAPITAPVPTDPFSELPDEYVSLGYLSEDGIVNGLETDSESITAFGGDTVLTIRTSTQETFVFRPIEKNEAVLAETWGQDNVQLVEDPAVGKYLVAAHSADEAQPRHYVFELSLNGDRVERIVVPNGKVTEVGENNIVHNDAQGHELTISASTDTNGKTAYEYIAAVDDAVYLPTVEESTYTGTKAAFDKVLEGLGLGPDPHNVGDQVFYIVLDKPLSSDDDYLVTVAVNGKTYGLTRPHGGSYLSPKIIYFSMVDGHQVDFVDGVRKQSDTAAKCDLSKFSGDAVVTLYKTDAQTEGTYPTGLVRIQQQTITFANGD